MCTSLKVILELLLLQYSPKINGHLNSGWTVNFKWAICLRAAFVLQEEKVELLGVGIASSLLYHELLVVVGDQNHL